MKTDKQASADKPVGSTDGLETLLPCPFCGSSAIGFRYEGQPANRYAFLCGGCGASTGSVYVGGTASGSSVLFNNPEAIKKWNMRANAVVSGQPPKPGGQVGE